MPVKKNPYNQGTLSDDEWTAFSRQLISARNRGIEWCFTPEEWLAVWTASGKLAERGVKKEQYVMCRKGDVGPYSPENTFIGTCSQNSTEANIGRTLSEEAKAKLTGPRWHTRAVTPEQVEEIRALTTNRRDTALMYGISEVTVKRIRNKHLGVYK